jgi:hypothetical protein
MPGSAIFDTSLVDSIYQDVVDGVRLDLLPEMGIRPYRVFVVRRTWSNYRVGAGHPTDIATELTPIPRVHEWSTLRYNQQACGILEEGDVKITECSLSYTHSEIGANEPSEGEQIMLRIDEGHGQQTHSRFFVHAAAPFQDREEGMGWVLQLRKVAA